MWSYYSGTEHHLCDRKLEQEQPPLINCIVMGTTVTYIHEPIQYSHQPPKLTIFFVMEMRNRPKITGL